MRNMDPDLCIKLNEYTDLRNNLIELLKLDQTPDLKENASRALGFLEAWRSSVQFGATSFLDHFCPILLRPEYQLHTPGTHIVRMNHPGQLTVPFDPVFSVPGAPMRPILMEKVANKPVKRDILRETYTVNDGVVFCCIISSNDLVMQENAVLLRVEIVDADLPMTEQRSFVAGKTKGGISFDSDGSIWTNGKHHDPTDPIDKWTRNQDIGLEIDLNVVPRTLRFFINVRQLSRYVSNIPARVRFFATTILEGDWFQVKQLFIQDHPQGQYQAGETEMKQEDYMYDYTTGI
ncbi:MAG: hypothetical protein EZS28_016870 [Streblomastix strix]|uniref:SPRY domain-containing protein n=1 Tax=Streblomastix strix TaxID=222440 RepID=A0A5J4VY69_9EUKA|nr:MAG: hypothetical protein EZS28_016870 [Streblomastix strix]